MIQDFKNHKIKVHHYNFSVVADIPTADRSIMNTILHDYYLQAKIIGPKSFSEFVAKTTEYKCFTQQQFNTSAEGLKIKIELEVYRSEDNEEYSTAEDVEIQILEHAKILGYNYENDKKRNKYCLKATQLEIWKYWLKNIIPKL
jgi:hypothetical protein